MLLKNLEQYHVFYTTAQLGSITKAAERLFLTQPSVSYAIKQLEESLGLRLFVRQARGVSLTAEGQALFYHVAAAMESLQQGEQTIKRFLNLQGGQVRIGTSDTLCRYFLLPVLEQFASSHPQIRLQITHGKTPEITEWLAEGRIDLGVVHLPVSLERFVVTELAHVQDVFVAGDRFKHLAAQPVPLRDVLAQPLIVLSSRSQTRSFLEKFVEAHDLHLEPDIEVGSVELMMEFARLGLGLSFVSREFIPSALAGVSLHEVQTEETIPARRIGIAALRNRPLSIAATAFMTVLEASSADD